MQWSSGVGISTSSPGGEQVRPCGPNTGALQHGAEVRRCPQHAAIRDVGKGPERKSERQLDLYVLGLPSEGSEVSALQRRGERGRASATHTRD